MKMSLTDYMTSRVHTIGKTLPIETAWKQMLNYKIRHLPVLEGGKLVGIISDRDLRYLVSLQPAENLVVGDVMVQDPYVVLPEADLAEVASEMATHRYGSTIIQDKTGNLVGIFTFEDGMRALSDLIRQTRKEQAA